MTENTSLEASEASPEALSTWGAAGNGYSNQEGHKFIYIGLSDSDENPYLFESVATPGHIVAGRKVAAGKIHTGEAASELAGLATIEGSLEDGELTNHSNAATFWEMELGSLATTGADDVVRIKLATRYTDTKWLSLSPEQYEKLETFLLSIEDAEPMPERFSKFAAVQGSIRAGLMTGDFIACTGNSETGEFRITTTGEPFTVRLTRNADRSITTTKIEG